MNSAKVAKFCTSALDYIDALNQGQVQFEIFDGRRARHFMVQLAHESGGFTKFEENLNYSVEGLLAEFSRSRISEEDCHRLGRSAEHHADREGIANTVYGGAWGAKHLGNLASGDGWKHRGMGVIQLTGRDNHRRCSLFFFNDERLVADPSWLLTVPGCVLSASWFWSTHSCNAAADQDDLAAVRRLVNGGTVGLPDCEQWNARAIECGL